MAGRRKGSSESSGLTPLELQMMQVLWRDGPSNVQHVQEEIPGNLAYTTVQTVLNTLHQKGKVRRKLEGRAFLYRAAVAREKVVGDALHDFVNRMFGGSPQELVLNLIQSRQLDVKKIAALLAAERESEDE
jgi:predicted transcriptional regulator